MNLFYFRKQTGYNASKLIRLENIALSGVNTLASRGKFMSSLLIRALGTLIYGFVFVWLVITGGLPLLVALVILSAIGAYEFYRLARQAGHHPLYAIGIVSASIFSVSAYFNFGFFSQAFTAVVVLTFFWVGLRNLFQQKSNGDSNQPLFLDWSYTLLGALYSGAFLAHAMLIRNLPNGSDLLLLVIFGAATCDSASYLIGKNLGKRPFFQRISPHKTWEGAIGGLVSCILIEILLVNLFQVELGLLHAIFLGVLIGLSEIFGDLVESMFKRSAGVKDSGSWIPEQGGLLDVMDGFLIAVVVSYYYYSLVIS
jgi:phosphatidate cytidylyltransferase